MTEVFNRLNEMQQENDELKAEVKTLKVRMHALQQRQRHQNPPPSSCKQRRAKTKWHEGLKKKAEAVSDCTVTTEYRKARAASRWASITAARLRHRLKVLVMSMRQCIQHRWLGNNKRAFRLLEDPVSSQLTFTRHNNHDFYPEDTLQKAGINTNQKSLHCNRDLRDAIEMGFGHQHYEKTKEWPSPGDLSSVPSSMCRRLLQAMYDGEWTVIEEAVRQHEKFRSQYHGLLHWQLYVMAAHVRKAERHSQPP